MAVTRTDLRPESEEGSKGKSGGLASITARAVALCLLASIGLAVIAYGVGKTLPPTYQSSGMIRVAVPSQQGVVDPVVTAANDTASQYAQLASSQPVAAMTAARLHLSSTALRGKINGSTVGAQNLVQVTVSSGSAGGATSGAAAATASLQRYITGLNSAAGAQYIAEVQSSLAGVNRRIGKLTVRIARDTPSAAAANAVVLESLNSERDQLLGQVARDAASNRPTLQLVQASSPASVVSPQPKLYALAAFVVGLIISGRLAFVLVRRRFH